MSQPAKTRARKAAPDKGAAARAETRPEARVLRWRGLELTLPPTMPVMGVTAAFRRLERAAASKDEQGSMGYLVDIVDKVLGGDETASDRVWDLIDSSGTDEAEAAFDLVEAAAACYGLTPGESSASR